MTDDVRRVLTDEGRARIQAAKVRGGTCALCGRALAEGETVWIERLGVGPAYNGRGAIYWRAPVCGACASPASRAETEGTEPERCAGCGRPIYYGATARGRRVALCSKRCGSRYHQARAREAKERG